MRGIGHERALLFEGDGNRVERAIALLRRKGEVLEPGDLESRVCRDPDDDQILALVAEGEADVLVTGDDDLLVLGSYEESPILSPRRRPPPFPG